MNIYKSTIPWYGFMKLNYSLPLLLSVIVFCLFLGAAVAFEAHLLVLILLVPVLLMYITAIPISEKNQKRIFFLLGSLFLAAALFWPRYAYMRLGGLPGLTPTRLILAIFLFLAIAYVFRSKNIKAYLSEIHSIRYHPLIYIFIFSAFRFLSVIFTDNPFASVYGFLNEFVFFTIMTILFLLAFRTVADIERTAELLVYATFLICVIGFLEYALQKNVFANMLPISDDYAREALLSKIRDSGYRIQATFDHPLTYSQFLATVLPLLTGIFLIKKNIFQRIVALIALVMALTSIWLTGSRSAAILSIVSFVGLGGGILILQFFQRKARLHIIILAIFAIIFTTGIGALLIDQLQALVSGRSASEASSTSARLLMLHRAIPLILDSPLVGHGVNQAAALIGFVGAGGVLTVDSLLISFAVESGVVALVAYIFCIFSAITFSLRTAINNTNSNTVMQLALATSIFIFFVTTITLSLSGNIFFLAFLLAAVLASRSQVVAR